MLHRVMLPEEVFMSLQALSEEPSVDDYIRKVAFCTAYSVGLRPDDPTVLLACSSIVCTNMCAEW